MGQHEVDLFWKLKAEHWPDREPDYKVMAHYWNRIVTDAVHTGKQPCQSFKGPKHLKEFADSQAAAQQKLQALPSCKPLASCLPSWLVRRGVSAHLQWARGQPRSTSLPPCLLGLVVLP